MVVTSCLNTGTTDVAIYRHARCTWHFPEVVLVPYCGGEQPEHVDYGRLVFAYLWNKGLLPLGHDKGHDKFSSPLGLRLDLVPCGNHRQQVWGQGLLVLALLVQHPEAGQGPLQGGDPGGCLHRRNNGTKLSLASYLILQLTLHLVSGGVGHLLVGVGDLLVLGVYLQDLAHSSQVTRGHDGDLMEHSLGVSSPLITPLLMEMSERRLQSLNGGSGSVINLLLEEMIDALSGIL